MASMTAAALVAAAMEIVAGLEAHTGVPIAVLDRIEDTQAFWARSAAILCEKTGDTFCEDSVRFMTANTEAFGMSRIIVYKNEQGQQKKVCALLPPVANPDPTTFGEAFGGGIPQAAQAPGYAETYVWLLLYNAAHCIDTDGKKAEEQRAMAFATLGLTLTEGDPIFTAGYKRGASRKLAVMTGDDAAYWAAGIGERALLEVWKKETAQEVRRKYSCSANVVPATSTDVEKIRRDSSLDGSRDCSDYWGRQADIKDSNLWIWMYGNGGVGAPPVTWSWGKLFSTKREAAGYMWSTAETLASQY